MINIAVSYLFQIRKTLSKKDEEKHKQFLDQSPEEESISSPTVDGYSIPRFRSGTPSRDCRRQSNSVYCIFCGEIRSLNDSNVRAAAGLVSNKINSLEDKAHVIAATKKWRQVAEDIGHLDIISVIGTNSNPTVDLRAAEIFYDLSCYSSAKRKQNRKFDESDPSTTSKGFSKVYAAKQTAAFLQSYPCGKAIKLTELWPV